MQDLPSTKRIPAGLATEKRKKINSLYGSARSYILVSLCAYIQQNNYFIFKYFGISFTLVKRVFARRQ